jgi:hypothetical protein
MTPAEVNGYISLALLIIIGLIAVFAWANRLKSDADTKVKPQSGGPGETPPPPDET